MQRFAHAHQHDIESLTLQIDRVGEHSDLTHDFAGRQIPDKAHLSGQAERARHGATNLRRDAERHRGRIGDEHRFDLTTVG